MDHRTPTEEINVHLRFASGICVVCEPLSPKSWPFPESKTFNGARLTYLWSSRPNVVLGAMMKDVGPFSRALHVLLVSFTVCMHYLHNTIGAETLATTKGARLAPRLFRTGEFPSSLRIQWMWRSITSASLKSLVPVCVQERSTHTHGVLVHERSTCAAANASRCDSARHRWLTRRTDGIWDDVPISLSLLACRNAHRPCALSIFSFPGGRHYFCGCCQYRQFSLEVCLPVLVPVDGLPWNQKFRRVPEV